MPHGVPPRSQEPAGGPLRITSPQNPKIAYVRRLAHRRARQREGRLVVEGQRLLNEALAAGSRPDFVLLSEAFHASPTGVELFECLRRQAVAVYEVADRLWPSLARTVHPQGVIAVVPTPRLPEPATPDLVLVADAVRDPGNLGTLLRAALASGTQLVITTPGTVDPTNDKVVRSAMGAHFRLPIRELSYDAVWPAIAGLAVWVADTHASLPYDMVDWRRPSALVIGSEAAGPSAAALSRGQPIAIPMAAGVESLNAAVAGAIILFEARRQRAAFPGRIG